jgi:hypothetical protein
MTQSNTQITPAMYDYYRVRAHQLRNEALHDMVSEAARAVRGLFSQPAAPQRCLRFCSADHLVIQ